MTDFDPRASLAEIRTARAGLAEPTAYPLGYDLLYGTVCGLLVAAQGLPQPWPLPVLAVALMGLGYMVTAWRRRFGWWVNGYAPPRARWVAFGMAALFVALIGLSLYGRYYGPPWLFLISGALGFVSAIAGSRLWMRVWRRELAEGPE